jgi:ferredoxin-NADP reductase
VVLDCGGHHNAYSLTGPGVRPREYRVSVLRKSQSRGGSAWVHERLTVGDRLAVSLPRNMFAPVATATKHLLIAGGIGITPLIAHAREALRWRREIELIYGHRPGAGALLEEVLAVAGERVRTVDGGRAQLMDVVRVALQHQPLGTHLAVCGPSGLIDAVQAEAFALGWPEQRVHCERFAAAYSGPGRPFTAILRRSRRRVEVPSGVSLLSALDAAGVAVPRLCRQGICGQCRVEVLAGRPIHLDLYLSDEEKHASDALMCCVSRAEGDVELKL